MELVQFLDTGDECSLKRMDILIASLIDRSLVKETMKFIQTGAVWSVKGETSMFTNNTLSHKVCTRTVASLGARRSEGKENTASLGTEARDSWSTSVSPWWHFGHRRGERQEGPQDWGWLEYLLVATP